MQLLSPSSVLRGWVILSFRQYGTAHSFHRRNRAADAWLFGIALFVMSILLYSQAATVRALMPLGIALGISPYMLIALFPAVNGYFFIPNYPTVVAAINFDRTGTTKIGKYVLNHSFMMPGLVSTVVAIVLGLLFIQIF
mgnify:CR=1 FL=1